ncbi:hypothetical protein [Cucumibacter marinus]|uniref:hypothetical protein n=1 Tax=Cucumibacter marinus TaxID=1121252 RepID=UPI0004197212|nr:hypothetical protein [Cucumibacter marinus]
MQLARYLAPLGLVALTAFGSISAAHGQSLSPMRKDGLTLSDMKGFRVAVSNPYQKRMAFVLEVMDPEFETPVGDAVVQPARLVLAPGYGRHVILAFKIPPNQKERTIGLCVRPEEISGSILPRVCGTFVGRRAHAASAGG